MLAAQRQAWILQEVRQRGAVRVTELVSALRVSDMTVRRDLDSLAEQGLVTKVHGGATARGGSSTDEPAFSVKAARQRRAKEAIARAAADLVRPGTAIGVSAGSTTYAFAQQLARVPDLTVVTNSPPVADLLHALPGPPQTVILTGGVRTISDALVGPVAIQAIRRLHLDCVFIGVHGIDAEAMAEQSWCGDAVQAGGAVGQVRPVAHHDRHDLAEAQGDDGKVVAAQPQRRRAEQDAEERRQSRRQRQSEPE